METTNKDRKQWKTEINRRLRDELARAQKRERTERAHPKGYIEIPFGPGTMKVTPTPEGIEQVLKNMRSYKIDPWKTGGPSVARARTRRAPRLVNAKADMDAILKAVNIFTDKKDGREFCQHPIADGDVIVGADGRSVVSVRTGMAPGTRNKPVRIVDGRLVDFVNCENVKRNMATIRDYVAVTSPSARAITVETDDLWHKAARAYVCAKGTGFSSVEVHANEDGTVGLRSCVPEEVALHVENVNPHSLIITCVCAKRLKDAVAGLRGLGCDMITLEGHHVSNMDLLRLYWGDVAAVIMPVKDAKIDASVLEAHMPKAANE